MNSIFSEAARRHRAGESRRICSGGEVLAVPCEQVAGKASFLGPLRCEKQGERQSVLSTEPGAGAGSCLCLSSEVPLGSPEYADAGVVTAGDLC